MCREQKTAEAGWSLGGSMEGEVPKGARSIGTPIKQYLPDVGLKSAFDLMLEERGHKIVRTKVCGTPTTATSTLRAGGPPSG
jgi:hypothetical protein